MRSRTLVAIAALCVTVTPWGPAQAQAPDRSRPWDPNWSPPRTERGHPDLQGNWSNATLTPFARRAGDGPTYRWAEV